jgi:hypothetical protein
LGFWCSNLQENKWSDFKGQNEHEFQPLETIILSRNVGFQSPDDNVTSHPVRASTLTAPLESPNSCKSKLVGT